MRYPTLTFSMLNQETPAHMCSAHPVDYALHICLWAPPVANVKSIIKTSKLPVSCMSYFTDRQYNSSPDPSSHTSCAAAAKCCLTALTGKPCTVNDHHNNYIRRSMLVGLFCT